MKQEVLAQRLGAFLDEYEGHWKRYSDPKVPLHVRGVWWTLECMRTRNEDAMQGQPKHDVPMPDKPHVRTFVEAFFREKRLVVDKSRQMMVTWMCCGLATFEAMFLEATNIGYQNMSLLDSCSKLEDYMLYTLTHQPLDLMLPWVKGKEGPPDAWVLLVAKEIFGPDGEEAFGRALTPPKQTGAKESSYHLSPAWVLANEYSNRYNTYSGSEGVEVLEYTPFFDPTPRLIKALPEGPDQWRSETRTRCIHDEHAFHSRLSDCVSSALKSAGRNGYQTLVSTASQGKDGDGYPLTLIKAASAQPRQWEYPPLEGISFAKTEQGYTHLRIHYRADPEKRDRDFYISQVLTGDRRKNLREMEISYDTPENEPFYTQFDSGRARVSVTPNPHTPELFFGQDGGRTPATLVFERNEEGRLLATLEVVSENMSIEAHAVRFESIINKLYPHWRSQHRVFYDPSMDNKHETTDESAADRLRKRGWVLEPGAQDPDIRFQAMATLCETIFLEDGYGSKPRLLIDSNRCPVFWHAMDGGCEIDPAAHRSGLNRKRKNRFSHIAEAGEYIATRLRPVTSSKGFIPKAFQPKRSNMGRG